MAYFSYWWRCGVNSLGQDIGDELLRQLGERLQQWAATGLNVARLDGNEFALLGTLSSTHEASAQHEALALIEQIVDALTAEYALHGHRYLCRLSVGVLVFSPREHNSSAPLFKRAGLALLAAKRLGDGRLQFFQQAQENELEERLALERELLTMMNCVSTSRRR